MHNPNPKVYIQIQSFDPRFSGWLQDSTIFEFPVVNFLECTIRNAIPNTEFEMEKWNGRFTKAPEYATFQKKFPHLTSDQRFELMNVAVGCFNTPNPNFCFTIANYVQEHFLFTATTFAIMHMDADKIEFLYSAFWGQRNEETFSKQKVIEQICNGVSHGIPKQRIEFFDHAFQFSKPSKEIKTTEIDDFDF